MYLCVYSLSLPYFKFSINSKRFFFCLPVFYACAGHRLGLRFVYALDVWINQMFISSDSTYWLGYAFEALTQWAGFVYVSSWINSLSYRCLFIRFGFLSQSILDLPQSTPANVYLGFIYFIVSLFIKHIIVKNALTMLFGTDFISSVRIVHANQSNLQWSCSISALFVFMPKFI